MGKRFSDIVWVIAIRPCSNGVLPGARQAFNFQRGSDGCLDHRVIRALAGRKGDMTENRRYQHASSKTSLSVILTGIVIVVGIVAIAILHWDGIKFSVKATDLMSKISPLILAAAFIERRSRGADQSLARYRCRQTSDCRQHCESLQQRHQS